MYRTYNHARPHESEEDFWKASEWSDGRICHTDAEKKATIFFMKCLPCRDNFPKCFLRWCISPLMFSRIEMCFFFLYRHFFFKYFVCVDILSFKSFPNGHFLVEVFWCIEIFTECFCCLDTFEQFFWYRAFRSFFVPDGTLLV